MASKGDLSINVIIVAVLALLVLVVLAAIFIAKLRNFEGGVSKETPELAQMRIFYGTCHPTASAENAFSAELAQAEDDAAKDAAKAKFKDASALCKQVTDKESCSGECIWG